MALTIGRLPSLLPPGALSRRRTALAGALLVASAAYFLAEVVTATGWPQTYSWSHNMISDLGVPECLGYLSGPTAASERFVCSPWHPLMNTAFVAVGLAGIAAAVAIRPRIPHPWDRVALALAAINGVALALVGLFPGSAGEFPNGPTSRIVVHPVAAYLEHVTGMALMALAVVLLLREHRLIAATTAALFAVSGLAAIVIIWGDPLGAGATERAAIDPFLWWRVLVGIVVLTSLARASTTHRTPLRPVQPRARTPLADG